MTAVVFSTSFLMVQSLILCNPFFSSTRYIMGWIQSNDEFDKVLTFIWIPIQFQNLKLSPASGKENQISTDFQTSVFMVGFFNSWLDGKEVFSFRLFLQIRQRFAPNVRSDSCQTNPSQGSNWTCEDGIEIQFRILVLNMASFFACYARFR